MKKILILLSLQFAVWNLQFTLAQTFKVDTLLYNASPINQVNIVFLGDGFTSTQQDSLKIDAFHKMNVILSIPPFSQNVCDFSFYLIHVISPETGINHPGLWLANNGQCNVIPVNPKYVTNSYFNLSFDCGGIHRWILPTEAQSNLIMQTIAGNLRGYDGQCNYIPIVICNDWHDGGSEWGAEAVTTLSSESDNILLHELGHDIGGLGDEYQGAVYFEAWNNTQQLPVRWADIINGYIARTYEGQTWDIPTGTCRMDNVDQPYCAVCSNQLEKSFGEYISLAGGSPPSSCPSITITPPPPSCTAPVVTVYCPANYKNLFYVGIDNYTANDKKYNVKISLHNANVFVNLNSNITPEILGTYNGNTISSIKILPNTSYDVMVQKQCEDGSVSAWSTITLTTGTGLFYHSK